jgi:Flp pilus assembly protein CpaB
LKKISKGLIMAFGIAALLVVEILIVKVGSQYEPEVAVIYARTAIKAKTEIKDDMLVEKRISLPYVHKLSINNKTDIIGKKVKIDIEAGEMILSSRLGEVDEMQMLPMLDRNNRLFSIEFKPDQVNGWWLLSGQYVDIIFVPNQAAAAAPAATAAQQAGNDTGMETNVATMNTGTGITRISNVRVAAIVDESFKLVGNTARTGIPRYVCFEVAPEQDEFLAWAKSNGRLEISVRPVDEE